MPTVLPPDEVRRRIIAVRTLRGLEQAELAELMHQDGHGKHDLGRIERGDKPLQASHRRSIAQHLRIDERWLTDPDIVDTMMLAPADPIQPQLELLLAEMRTHDNYVQNRMEARAMELASIQTRLSRIEENQRGLLQSQSDLMDLGEVVRGLLQGMRDSAEALAVARTQVEIALANQESAQPRTAERGPTSTKGNSAAGT